MAENYYGDTADWGGQAPRPGYTPVSQNTWDLLGQYGSNVGGLNNPMPGYGDYQQSMGGLYGSIGNMGQPLSQMGGAIGGMGGYMQGMNQPMNQMGGILGDRSLSGPSAGYGQAWQGGMGALGGPGGASMWGVSPDQMKEMAANYMRGGGEAASKYESAATKNLQQTGKYAYNQLNQQAGGAGRLGSTVMGVDMADLAGRYGAERANIGATAAGMKEQNIQNRYGQAMGTLGSYAGLAEQERMGNVAGYGQMAGLEQNQQGLGLQERGQTLGGYGQLAGLGATQAGLAGQQAGLYGGQAGMYGNQAGMYGQGAGLGMGQQGLQSQMQNQQQQQLMQQLMMQYGFEQAPGQYQQQDYQNWLAQNQAQLGWKGSGGDGLGGRFENLGNPSKWSL